MNAIVQNPLLSAWKELVPLFRSKPKLIAQLTLDFWDARFAQCSPF